MDLRGKRALVTGAAKRVGRSIALHLAARGADLVLHYRSSADEATLTAADIRRYGVRCDLIQADLSIPCEVERLVRQIDGTGRPADILVNSASVFYKTPMETATEIDVDTFLDTNFKGPFLLSKEIGLRMARAQGGKIVNIADWSGFRPYRDYAPYCASKGALLTFTKSLAREFAPKVTANAVAPGPVMLPPDFTEAERKAIEAKTVVGRIGDPEDVAHAVVLLLENDYLNGTVLVVDGGRSLV